jgi:hypothetical protein
MSATRAPAPPPGWVSAQVGDTYEGGPCACGAPLELGSIALLSWSLHTWACSAGCAARLTPPPTVPVQEALPVWLGGSS